MSVRGATTVVTDSGCRYPIQVRRTVSVGLSVCWLSASAGALACSAGSDESGSEGSPPFGGTVADPNAMSVPTMTDPAGRGQTPAGVQCTPEQIGEIISRRAQWGHSEKNPSPAMMRNK